MPLKRDLALAAVIGIAVGLLVQPVLYNFSHDPSGIIGDYSAAVRIIIFLVVAIGAPVALAICGFLSRFWKPFYQIGKFASVGVLNTFVDFGVLNLLIAVGGGLFMGMAGFAFPIMKAISFIFATLNSYFWNKHWTFQSKSATTFAQTVKFYAVAFIAFLANVGIAAFVVNLMSDGSGIISTLWANVGALLGIVISLFINFLGYKFFVFTDKRR